MATRTFRRTEYIALALSAASGSLLFGALPVSVGAAVSLFGGTARGGWAAAAELGTMGIVSVLISTKLSALRGRSTALLAASLLILGQALSAFAAARAHWPIMLLSRALVGIGEGGLFTIANALAARSPRPDRTFTGIAFAQTALIAVFYGTMALVNPSYDPVRVFVVFATIAAIAAIPLAGMPRDLVGDEIGIVAVAARASFTPVVRQVLIGFAVYSVALYILFPYVEAVGIANGFTHGQVATVLGLGSIAALIGPGITATIGMRFGRWAPILVAVAAQIAASLILVYSRSVFLWGAAELASIALLYVLDPLLFGLIAHLEPSGRATAAASAIRPLTAAIGPSIGGGISAFTTRYESVGWCNVIAYLVMVAILWVPGRAAEPASSGSAA